MTAVPDRISLTEFLEREQAQPGRWEFADGHALPMTGTTDSHGQIVLNLGTLIRTKLRGTDCRVFANMVKVVAGGRSTYPDIVVTCDPRDRNDRCVKRYPCLLVEVLSMTTVGDDLSDKFAAYRCIETLAEYLTPDSRKRGAQLWRKNFRGHWELVADQTDGDVYLETLNVTVALDELYEDVELRPDLAARKTRHPMAADSDRLSFARFLAWEERQEGRFEFADGEVVPMSGGTGDHTRIADNFRNRLKHHFGAGSSCYAYGSDRKVRVPRLTGDGARYPDATVTCAENDHGKALIICSPVVTLAVVSHLTVSINTTKKPREYTALPMLIATSARRFTRALGAFIHPS